MAKYNVTYRCGHQETVQLFGKYNDRYNGTNESYFADYKGGIVSIYCNETEEDVYTEVIR